MAVKYSDQYQNCYQKWLNLHIFNICLKNILEAVYISTEELFPYRRFCQIAARFGSGNFGENVLIKRIVDKVSFFFDILFFLIFEI